MCLLAPERVEGQCGRVHPPAAPAGAPVEQLVARHADEQRRTPPPARQILDQVEHPLVGPVDVLDREDHRLLTAGGVDQRPHGGEQALAHLLRVVGLGAVEPRAGGGLDPERPAERGREPLRRLLGLTAGHEALDPAVELSPGRGGVVGVDDLERPADDLGQRPVGEPGAVGGAAAQAHRRRVLAVADPDRELAQQPRLADARLADHGDQVRPLLADHLLEQAQQPVGLDRAPDQRGGGGRGARGAAGDHRAHGLPGRHAFGLALELQGLELDVLDCRPGQAVRELADGHGAGLGRALEARGDVDRIADHRVAVADAPRQDLAGVDPDPKCEVGADVGGDLVVDLAHRVLHRKPRPHRALGVVLVRDGSAEDSHDVVADVLVDGPAVALDLLAQTAQGAVDQ